MKVAVLGGTGYLGSRLIHALLEEEHEVICIHRETSCMEKLEEIKSKIKFCLSDTDSLKECLFSKEKIDCIINTSCSYEVINKSIEDVIESNLSVPLNVLNLAVDAKIKQFITVGTGLPNNFNAYTLTKKQLSDFGLYFSERKKIDFVNLKVENFYGPGEPINRFLPSSIKKLRNGEDLNITLGTQKRDFVHVDDVIGIMLYIMKGNCSCPSYIDLSVGTGEAPHIYEIINYVAQQLNSESKINFGAVPMRENEPNCVADITELTRMGYRIKFDWKKGIKSMLEEEE